MYHIKVILKDKSDQEALDKVSGLAVRYGGSCSSQSDDSVICSFPEQYQAQVFRNLFDHTLGKHKPPFNGFKRVWAYWWVGQFGHPSPILNHQPTTEPKIADQEM
jgi:hypothetical protein